MNVFEAVKQSVTTRQIAELYGIKVSRNGMCRCPFHNDKTPSMKVDKRFHCFGCGADGDVIDFTAKLYGLGVKDAVEKLAKDFSIPYDSKSRASPKSIRTAIRQKSDAEKYKEAENRCFRVYSDYFHQLRRWEEEYAPQPEDADWQPLFVEALQKKSYIEYLLDILLYGEIEEKASLVAEHGKEVVKLEQRLSELAARDAGSRHSDSISHATKPERGRSQRKSGMDR